MNGTKQTKFNKRTLALAVASCLSLAPLVAESAGLGKLTVLSGLGQPLRAEVEIGAARDEMAGMTARLAPQDVFKQAGVDFATVLLDLRFAVEKRPNGQAVVKVTSAKPINEPFLDFLVELNWPAGRLVREYTFLLDPPEIAAMQARRPVAQARVVETVRGGAPEKPKAETPAAVRQAPPSAKPAAQPKPAGNVAATRVVEKGDTLRKIASETRHEGVSLEQMLVGLFRNNPDAFIADNVNRLKAGAILNVPDKSTVETVSEAEAKQIYVRHAGDWNAYRQKLAASTAAAPAKEEAVPGQASSGKITAKVEEKAAPAEQAKDQVKVTRADAAAKGVPDGKAAELAAEQVARDKALKEAQERLAVLEKNFNDLQKLLELKDQKLAELQKSQVPAEPAKPVEPTKSAEPAKPVEPEPAPAAKVEPPPAPVEPPKAVEPAKPEPAKPVAPPPVPTPPIAEEPGLIDGLLEDPVPLAGGGIVALLLAYFVAKRRRASNASMETTAAPMPSSLGPNSVFRMTGGQSVDTGNTPPQTGEFSQTGPGTIDTDEVDPVAEADVYMAYGRDTQAEEILLEALQKDPQRTAIHAKLLEIYAARRSVKQFETLAGELYGQTGGRGADWAKAAALGLALDPNNPLYSNALSTGSDAPPPAAEEGEVPPAPVAEVPSPAAGDAAERRGSVFPSDEFERDTMLLPKATETSPRAVLEVPADEGKAEEAPDFASGGMTLDFDLGEQAATDDVSGEELAGEVVSQAVPEVPLPEVDKGALDFDLGGGEPLPEIEAVPAEDMSAVATQVSPVSEAMDFDFDINESAQSLLQPGSVAKSAPDFSPEGTMVIASGEASDDIDVGLGTWVGGEVPSAPLEAAEASPTPEVQVAEEISFDEASPLTQTVVDHLAGTDTLVGQDFPGINVDDSNPQLANTVVNPNVVDTDSLEFDVKLTDSMFLGQPMETPDFNMGSINLDLSAAPASEAAAPADEGSMAPVAAEPEASSEAPFEEPAAEPAVSAAQWEEVNTKLDLAKAYEEMGDLEGARELLQEVVSEGPADLVEQACSILGRIGG